MTGHPFIFPPPPPAPQASQSYPANTQIPAPHKGYGGGEHRYHRGNRGQGRGNGRGGSRGGHVGSSHSMPGYAGYSQGDTNHHLPPQARSNNQQDVGYPLPDYPPVQLPQYPANLRQDYDQSSSAFPLTMANQRAPQAAYSARGRASSNLYSGLSQYASQGYGSPVYNSQSAAQMSWSAGASQPRPNAQPGLPMMMMGPPIHIGLDGQPSVHQAQQVPQPLANVANSYKSHPPSRNNSPYRHTPPMGSYPTRHNSPNSYPGRHGRGLKRGHGDAFGRPRNQNQGTQVAPAVPSFGGPLPLPVKPPPPQEASKKPKKKKRKHNQLGLTPKTEEHESSEEEEDDADEEFRLAAAAGGSGMGLRMLQFSYRGKTSTLKSSSDVSAWIAERRKHFPTKARAAELQERKRQREEAQIVANQVLNDAQEKQKNAAKEKHDQKTEVGKKRKKTRENKISAVPDDAATRAKRKVEKLRKRLEKEEKRIAKAEAKAGKIRGDTEADTAGHSSSARHNVDKKRKREDSDGSISSPKVGQAAPWRYDQPTSVEIAGDTTIKIEPSIQVKQEPSETAPHDFRINKSEEKVEEAASIVPDPLTPTSQPSGPNEIQDLPPPALGSTSNPGEASVLANLPCGNAHESGVADIEQSKNDSSVSVSDSSSDMSSTDSEDLTSPSGSSSSDADTEDDAPGQASSKRNGPEKVAPPKRAKARQICRSFLKTGRCNRGDACKFRHELPERGSRDARKKDTIKAVGRKDRIRLHQLVSVEDNGHPNPMVNVANVITFKLVEQEKDQEDNEILAAIIHLGERGLLDNSTQDESRGHMVS